MQLEELEKSLSSIMERQANGSSFHQYTLGYSFKAIKEHWRPKSRTEGWLDKLCKPFQGLFMRLGFHDLALFFAWAVTILVANICIGKIVV